MLIPMADVPRWHADRNGHDTVAIIHGDDSLTWGELERNANQRARAFAQMGVKPGDFVAVGLPNSNVFYENTFAIWKCGATPCSLSYRLPSGEAAAILELLRPSLVIGGEADWNAPTSVPADFKPEGFSDEPVTGPIARYWKAMTSGGSTGRPKVIVDHQPAATDPKVPPLVMHEQVRLLNPGPVYHNAPFIISHSSLFEGGLLVGMPKFDALGALRLIERYRLEWVNFVPTMMSRIWSLPREERERFDLSSLRVVFHMAAPMPVWLKEAWIDWLGPERIYELYGGTERQAATVIPGTEWVKRKGSVGRVEIGAAKVVGEDGSDLPPGEVGEIYLKSAEGVGTTYHYMGAEPKRTADGWESLGDVGRIDTDGYIWLADRRSDMILRGGANVYPAEVEAALMAHPDITTCAVVGLPDPDLGARIHAIVQLADGQDADTVLGSLPEFLASRIGRPKHPESYELATDAVRDDAGKVRRTALRDERIRWLEDGREFRLRPIPAEAAKSA
ncbi:AMP-binding protein [Chelatococcus reniformis]|uniref:Acid--CoA ligase n=1 Tax=Chelatococcus reniformis TaxID=1494448 RepID=A0A916U9Q5_9HYPH|nr:AMP-binding protein [Chelatococcus reniformis]GGC63786.1 acid--CoA ligase [Chelatococcus reniformis]